MPHHVVPSTGHRLFYERRGDAGAPRKVVFSMGVGGTSRMWGPQQTRRLDERPGEFQYVVYDNRGVGFSDGHVPGRWTTSDMARDALSLLDALGWTEGVHAVGLSMGGMVTLEMLRQAEHGRFASVSLLSTTAGGLPHLVLQALTLPTGALRMAQVFLGGATASDRIESAARNGLRLMFTDEYLAQRAIDPVTGKEDTNENIVARDLMRRHEGYALEPPLTSIAKQVMAVVTHHVSTSDLAAIARKVNGNVIVVTGDADGLVHPANSHRIAKHMGVTPIVLPGAGHGANEQYAELVTKAIEDNILRSSSSSSSSRSSSRSRRATSRAERRVLTKVKKLALPVGTAARPSNAAVGVAVAVAVAKKKRKSSSS